MKIITIANDKWERALLKSKRGGEVFMTPTQDKAKKILVDYLATCRKIDPEETFLILCNNFDMTTFLTLRKILETAGLANQSLILCDISGSEVGMIHSLQRKKNLDFFRAVYGKSYWNAIGRFGVKN